MRKALQKLSQERMRKRSSFSIGKWRTEEVFNFIGIHPTLMQRAIEVSKEIVGDSELIAETYFGRPFFEIITALLPKQHRIKFEKLRTENEITCKNWTESEILEYLRTFFGLNSSYISALNKNEISQKQLATDMDRGLPPRLK